MRTASIKRHTKETQIEAKLRIEGKGRYDIATGIRFVDHMLELFTKHGGFDLTLKATGDLDVDQHHTVEDVGIALGEAVSAALGKRRGINRAGYFVMPMDETLGVAAGGGHPGRPRRAHHRGLGARQRAMVGQDSGRAGRSEGLGRDPTAQGRCQRRATATATATDADRHDHQ